MAKKKEQLWLRCINLGNNPSDAEIGKFLASTKSFDDYEVDILGLDFLPADGWETPTIDDDYKQFHKEFINIVHHWLETKRLSEGEEKWLSEHPVGCKSIFLSYNWDTKDPLDEIAFGKRYKTVFGLDKQPIQNYIVYQFGRFLESGQELRQCAEDQRYFIPNPSGKKQSFCSNACKQKAYRKRKNSP